MDNLAQLKNALLEYASYMPPAYYYIDDKVLLKHYEKIFELINKLEIELKTYIENERMPKLIEINTDWYSYNGKRN